MTSPAQVYHLNNNLKDSVCDDSGICRINYKFEWLNPEAVCSSNFVCTSLEGLICDEYGLIFTHTTIGGSKRVIS